MTQMSYSLENLYNLSEICVIKRAYCNFPELSLYNISPTISNPSQLTSKPHFISSFFSQIFFQSSNGRSRGGLDKVSFLPHLLQGHPDLLFCDRQNLSPVSPDHLQDLPSPDRLCNRNPFSNGFLFFDRGVLSPSLKAS